MLDMLMTCLQNIAAKLRFCAVPPIAQTTAVSGHVRMDELME